MGYPPTTRLPLLTEKNLMTFYNIFAAEHDSIRELLLVLTIICNSIEAGRRVDMCHLDKLHNFIALFIDQYHHRKEDDLLLPAMEAAGFPRYGGMLDAISLDHEMARHYLEGMRQAVAAFRTGDQTALNTFAAQARKYIAITQYNLEQENRLLFLLADRRLTPQQKAQLSHDIDAWDIIPPEEIARQHSSLDFLKGQYLTE
jgi:hemerythrin-like domain-containing protein